MKRILSSILSIVEMMLACLIQPNQYLLYYAKACNEFMKLIYAPLRLGNTASFEDMLQQWRAVGNNVSALTGPRFEPHTSCSMQRR